MDTVTSPPPIVKNENKVLLDKLTEENKRIQDYITLLKQQQTTDIQKRQFHDKKNQQFTTIYNWLFVVYLIGLIIVIYRLFMQPSEMSRNGKIIIVVGFLVYPFLVYPFERTIGWLIQIVYRFIVRAPIGENPVQAYQRNRGDIFVTS